METVIVKVRGPKYIERTHCRALFFVVARDVALLFLSRRDCIVGRQQMPARESVQYRCALLYNATNTTNATTTVGALKLLRQQGLLMTAAALG
jgi:hypothetical protein